MMLQGFGEYEFQCNSIANEPKIIYELDGMMNVDGWETVILMELWCDEENAMDLVNDFLIAKRC